MEKATDLSKENALAVAVILHALSAALLSVRDAMMGIGLTPMEDAKNVLIRFRSAESAAQVTSAHCARPMPLLSTVLESAQCVTLEMVGSRMEILAGAIAVDTCTHTHTSAKLAMICLMAAQSARKRIRESRTQSTSVLSLVTQPLILRTTSRVSIADQICSRISTTRCASTALINFRSANLATMMAPSATHARVDTTRCTIPCA